MSDGDFKEFQKLRDDNIQAISKNDDLKGLTHKWFQAASDHQYSYNFDWLGIPIIQFPQDMVAIQEIIWKTKPDVIIETGVARGGSLILSASILHLLNGDGKVLGVDIEIKPHNRKAIENHPLASRIHLIEGSSTDEGILEQVKSHVQPGQKVMVILDSNHTHEHVFNELELYSPFVTQGCYLLAMDTVVDDMPEDYYPDRPWGKGDNPKTAVHEFLKTTDRFEIDKIIDHKILISVSPDGYLKCVK